jgi:hypothetical protein
MQQPDNILDHRAISGCYLFPQRRVITAPFLVQVTGAELACYRRIIDPDLLTVFHYVGQSSRVFQGLG